MEPIYTRIRARAREIASHFPIPDFYIEYSEEYETSQAFFDSDTTISEIKKHLNEEMDDTFGHGMKHATKVSVDAGSLILIEGKKEGLSESTLIKRMRLIQSAGLFHDIKRKHNNHAVLSANYAGSVLSSFSFDTEEIFEICFAIKNHEAFKELEYSDSSDTMMVSDCLYDADKFRWGSDNFTDTIWDMISASSLPLTIFVDKYPKGIEFLNRIKKTFRTDTGEKFGPQFINIGLAIGKELYDVIINEFT